MINDTFTYGDGFETGFTPSSEKDSRLADRKACIFEKERK